MYIRHTDIRGLPGEDGVSGRAIPTGGAGSFPALPAPGITGQMGRTPAKYQQVLHFCVHDLLREQNAYMQH